MLSSGFTPSISQNSARVGSPYPFSQALLWVLWRAVGSSCASNISQSGA